MAEREFRSTLGLFLLGAASGALLGVMFAPRSGKETRARMGDWLKTKRERTEELVQSLREKLPAQKERFAAAFKASKEAYREHRKEEQPVGA